MNNDESQSYFLSCKFHRPVFVKCLFIYVKDNDRYRVYSKQLFNVMANKFASEINSIMHSNKKRMSKTVSGNSNQIRKLQSEN